MSRMSDDDYNRLYSIGEEWEKAIKYWFESKHGMKVNVNVFKKDDGSTTQRKIVDGTEYVYPDLTVYVMMGSDVDFYVEVKSRASTYRNVSAHLDERKINPYKEYVFVWKYKFDFYKKFKKKFKKPVYIMFTIGNINRQKESIWHSAELDWLDKTKIYQSGYPWGKGVGKDKQTLYFWDIDDLKKVLH